MNNINKTLYIPLYGKSYVSHRGLILEDKKAEYIWQEEGFPLKGKSKSKWLAFYMAMRAKVFDKWVKTQINLDPQAIVLHIGCGMDGRVERVGANCVWYDIDFAEVIEARKKYYAETEDYHMLVGDLREKDWLQAIPKEKNAIIVLEGVSMYLPNDSLQAALKGLKEYFSSVNILMDFYTEFAAKMSKYRNPINDVGVTAVYGLDDPILFGEGAEVPFIKEHEMAPMCLINQLQGLEKIIFKRVYAGKIAHKMYKLYEFQTKNEV